MSGVPGGLAHNSQISNPPKEWEKDQQSAKQKRGYQQSQQSEKLNGEVKANIDHNKSVLKSDYMRLKNSVNNQGDSLPKAQALLRDFESARSPLTLRAYRTDLANFAALLKFDSTPAAVAQLIGHGPGEANRLALHYRECLQQALLAPATIARRLATLRSLCRIARMVGIITWALDLPGPRLVPYRDTRGPGRAGFQRLIQAAEAQEDPKKSRDLAILWLLYGRALRRSEVCRLTVPNDIDITGSRLHILGKHRAEPEWITVPPATKRALVQWLTVRGTASGPLFVRLDRVAAEAKRMSGDHGPLTGEAIRQLISTLGRRVNVRARPHGLRHAAITEALAASHGDLRAVQRYARLKSANTIKVYDDERADLGGEIARMIAP